jgi:hypothetical protein
MDLFLDWVKKHRDESNDATRTTYCSRFGSFRVGARKTRAAGLAADKVRGEDLAAWLGSLEQAGLSAQTRLPAAQRRTEPAAFWPCDSQAGSRGPWAFPPTGSRPKS